MKRQQSLFSLVVVCFLSSLSFQLSAQPITFSGNLDVIEDDAGGAVYSGVPQGTLFTGSIDPLTGAGEISDGTTITRFSCCIAAGGLDVTNNETIDAETASLLNLLVGTPSFSAGQVLDFIDIEGDIATLDNGRIEVGLSFVFSESAFEDESSNNYPFDPASVLLGIFFIVEEDEDGEEIYSAVGLLQDRISAAERGALLALYSDAGGAAWNSNDGWDPSPESAGTECTWVGVSCFGDSVVALNLMFNNLTGVIPSELAALTNLELLWLGRNNLTGSIPPELGSLSKLEELNLSGNQLTGSIPAQLANLNVDELSLNDNQLSGPLPPQLGNIATLRQLDVSFNQLTGPLPAELAGPVELELLWVNDNQLSGQIPQPLLDNQGLDFNFENNPGLFIEQPGPNPPPGKITLNSDGSSTTAMVSGGITKDGGSTYGADFAVGETIEIFVRLEPEAGDIGFTSEIYIVAAAGSDTLLVTPGGLVLWDGQLGNLIPFDEIVLAAENEFNILEPFGGQFTLTPFEIGNYYFFIGYTTAAGVVTYNDEPVQLNVTSQ